MVTGAAELDGGDGGKRISVPLSVQQKGMQGYRLIVDTFYSPKCGEGGAGASMLGKEVNIQRTQLS